ncbi:MAG: hypothetical protein ACYCYI_09480 [Saccharofermentanales bacterium]
MNKMIFDPNQTRFASDYQRKVWQVGTHIIPLDISLAKITDAEMREGCTQFYNSTIEILSDMYDNWKEYESIRPSALLMRSGLGQKNREDEYLLITGKLSKFGIVPDGDTKTLINKKYPLYDKYREQLLQAEEKIGHLRRGTATMCCDFRVLNKPFRPSIDDLVRPYSEDLRSQIKDLHDYVLSKGAKVEPHECYGRLRYRYNKYRVMVLELFAESEPLIEIPYRLDNARSMPDSFQSFINEAERQPDNDELIAYLQQNVDVCNGCGGLEASYKRCGGMWAEIRDKRRRLATCHFGIGRGHYDRQKLPYTDADFPMLKRMLDIRFNHIDQAIEQLQGDAK